MSDIWDEFWEERLHNQRVHHEAEIREIEAKHERVRSTMLNTYLKQVLIKQIDLASKEYVVLVWMQHLLTLKQLKNSLV